MGSSSRFVAAVLAGAALFAQEPAAAKSKALPPRHAEIVLAGAAHFEVRDFGLGDGGIRPGSLAKLRWGDSDVDCVTGGGVLVQVRSAGVKLSFAAEVDVLLSPDGYLHLRSGEKAGPFPTGVELWLTDGTRVRVVLGPSQRQRVRDVIVIQDDRVLQPWRRGERAGEEPRRIGPWPGARLACCGDGGDVYRMVALGPLLVLDRVLVDIAREKLLPAERLVVDTAPLVHTLDVMKRQHREPDAAVRRAIAAVAAVAESSDRIFPAGASLQRAERHELRWLLRGGLELQLDPVGPLGPRLQLFAGEAALPMIEWTLRPDGAAFLTNPRDDKIGTRWHGNGTRMPPIPPDLQAKEELFEQGYALKVIQRLSR